MSGSTELWIVIGVTIFLAIIIPVVTLWVRWKLNGTRRGGKRSISVQLEKMEVKKASKVTSGSSSTSDTDSKPSPSNTPGSKKKSQMPQGGQDVSGRLLDRAQHSGTESLIIIISGPVTHCAAGEIHIINNISINGRRPHHYAHQDQRIQEPPLTPPRIALDSRPLNRPARLPENQPWIHQDRSGRWFSRDEGYLHPGLPSPLYLWTDEPDIRPLVQVEDARRERLYVPGGWPC